MKHYKVTIRPHKLDVSAEKSQDALDFALKYFLKTGQVEVKDLKGMHVSIRLWGFLPVDYGSESALLN